MKIFLASGSPRRKELLGLLELPFTVLISDVEEKLTETDPVRLTESLSKQKAEAVYEKIEKEKIYSGSFCVIGADTVVFAENEAGRKEILGKPADKKDAERMIRSIKGNVHMVCTGVTLMGKNQGKFFSNTFSEKTKVFVADLSEEEIRHYLETEEPYDKAGAYGIQGLFSKFIEKIEGDYFNVVGLPVHR